MEDSRIGELGALLESLLEPVDAAIHGAMPQKQRQEVIDAGFFRPAENEHIAAWFARFVSLRTELLDIIRCVDELAPVRLRHISTLLHWQCFVIGYSAACLLVRLDRYFLFDFATHKTVQRKLNESFDEYRIPKKQYTAIFTHFTDPFMAARLHEVMKFADANRHRLVRLENDGCVGELTKRLPDFESYLDASKRNYLKRMAAFLSHSWRRRGARVKQQSMFKVLEGIGRTASELKLDKEKKVTPAILAEVSTLLEPGDVLVTRHRYALTNLFLPGIWPHAALYIGTPEQRDGLEIQIPEQIKHEWGDGISTFEALKDGVKLRPLRNTLAVDCFVVLRPALSREAIRRGIERVLVHSGKRYNFDFDFFRSDRLVCTEIVFRAFDGIENFHFRLQERAGRQTVSAEDLLDMAIDSEQFAVKGIFGYPEESSMLVRGDRARIELIRSYRPD